jgi:hypothetical protein
MTFSQVTNRRGVGSMSCCGHSQKLRAFTRKELETLRVAQELLGTLTIGRGSAWPGGVPGQGGWWRESKKSNKPSKPPEMYENGAKTAGLLHLMT